MTDDFKRDALRYHSWPTPGKLAMVPTKPLATQRDLALAYSPGVAAACEAIAEDGAQAMALTARGNLVAVISNGTAVLGLGAIGPLAAKPVMEGKAVLFKKFADIDVFDIEVDETDADRLVEVIAALEPTFGAINLEDIKAPECFEVERRLRERMNIPVFHDDQHGTAIVVGAALKNGLRVVDHFGSYNWLQRFERKHPAVIDQLRHDIQNGIVPVESRRTDDIEQLLADDWYRSRVAVLNKTENLRAWWHIAERSGLCRKLRKAMGYWVSLPRRFAGHLYRRMRRTS